MTWEKYFRTNAKSLYFTQNLFMLNSSSRKLGSNNRHAKKFNNHLFFYVTKKQVCKYESRMFIIKFRHCKIAPRKDISDLLNWWSLLWEYEKDRVWRNPWYVFRDDLCYHFSFTQIVKICNRIQKCLSVYLSESFQLFL